MLPFSAPLCHLLCLCADAPAAGLRLSVALGTDPTLIRASVLPATVPHRRDDDNAAPRPHGSGSEPAVNPSRTRSQPAVNCNGSTTDHIGNTTEIQANATAAQGKCR